MKKIYILLVIVTSLFAGLLSNHQSVNASEVYGYASMDNGVDVVNSVEIYDNGKVTLRYKYGLRKAVLYYCVKGEQCDNGNYLTKDIMEASIENPYKNDGEDLAVYNYNISLDKDKEYGIIVEAYFSASSYYSGTENIRSWPIRQLSADTKENYIKIGNNSINDDKLNQLLEDIQEIINALVIPIIYIVTTMVLVIKGALLGVQIVKNADNPDLRSEKIRALKWLVIGVAITYSASSLVGVVTGFFENAFNL